MLDIFFPHYVYLFWMKIWIRVVVKVVVVMKLKSMFLRVGHCAGQAGI